MASAPTGDDPVRFATVGLAGVTAYQGLERLEPLAGQTLIVTGPTGGVGAAAQLLARATGAVVVPHLFRTS